jgi:hypothetical protein
MTLLIAPVSSPAPAKLYTRDYSQPFGMVRVNGLPVPIGDTMYLGETASPQERLDHRPSLALLLETLRTTKCSLSHSRMGGVFELCSALT